MRPGGILWDVKLGAEMMAWMERGIGGSNGD